jgi:uncharacterized protein YceK
LKPRARRVTIAVLGLLPMTGCCTLNSLAGPEVPGVTKVYGGVKSGLFLLGEPSLGAWMAAVMIDLPLSAIADTVLLPVTIPMELLKEKEAPPSVPDSREPTLSDPASESRARP